MRAFRPFRNGTAAPATPSDAVQDARRESYFGQEWRIAHRRGKPRALLAVAHTQLVVVYHLLKNPNLHYRELGENYFDRRNEHYTRDHLVRRLRKLGYTLELTKLSIS